MRGDCRACGALRMATSCCFEQIAQLGAAFDGLVAGAVAERVEDGGGGLHAEVAGEQRGFEIVEGAFVDGAGESGEVGDFGGEASRGCARPPGACGRRGLFFWVFLGGFFGFVRCQIAFGSLLSSV